MESDPLYVQTMGNLSDGLHCAEAVTLAVLRAFGRADPLPAVRVASAFGGGIAGSTQELCGAFTGGVIALGSLLGREQAGRELKDCARHVKLFKEGFLAEFGSLQCRALLDAQAEQGQAAPSCAHITARAASLLGGLLREKPLLLNPAALSQAQCCGPQLAPGACPFGGCGC